MCQAYHQEVPIDNGKMERWYRQLQRDGEAYQLQYEDTILETQFIASSHVSCHVRRSRKL